MFFLPLAFLLASEPTITIQANGPREIGYEAGALGYDALVRGDNATAERQLLAGDAQMRQDSAWLINYGQVLARSGRVVDAANTFKRAARINDGELVLADGRVMSSRDAAMLALAQLQVTRSASR